MENRYFGEWVKYHNEEEKKEAMIYLTLWKKFFLSKAEGMSFIEEQFIDRPYLENLFGLKTSYSTLGLKITLNGQIKNEISEWFSIEKFEL